MILCLDKSYGRFFLFFCPCDSLIHFLPSALCIKRPILRLYTNNTGLELPSNYIFWALHCKMRFLWIKHSCEIQLRKDNIWALLQISSTITGESKNLFIQIKLRNYLNDRVRKFLWVCTLCAGHATVMVPSFYFRAMMGKYWKISSFLTYIHISKLRKTYGNLLSTFITSYSTAS